MLLLLVLSSSEKGRVTTTTTLGLRVDDFLAKENEIDTRLFVALFFLVVSAG